MIVSSLFPFLFCLYRTRASVLPYQTGNPPCPFDAMAMYVSVHECVRRCTRHPTMEANQGRPRTPTVSAPPVLLTWPLRA